MGVCFDFELPENVDKNLKYETEFIKSLNESLAKHSIKNKIRQLFFKYKFGNKFYEHGKE